MRQTTNNRPFYPKGDFGLGVADRSTVVTRSLHPCEEANIVRSPGWLPPILHCASVELP